MTLLVARSLYLSYPRIFFKSPVVGIAVGTSRGSRSFRWMSTKVTSRFGQNRSSGRRGSSFPSVRRSTMSTSSSSSGVRLRRGRRDGGIEWSAENIGRATLGTAGLCGLGALGYYGLGLAQTNGTAIADYADLWPDYVRRRVRSTFGYFGGGIALTAAAAGSLYTSGVARGVLATRPMMFAGVTFLGTIVSMFATMGIDYANTVPKHLAWISFNTCMGLSLVPICALGGPLLARAAVYTGMTVGSLCAIAACAPNDQFLKWGGALSVGLGVMVVTSLGTFFLPATSAAVPIIHSLSLYGGTILFGGFVLYDTQKIVLCAEQDEWVPFDPISQSIGIYMDTINLFVRIAQILAMSQGNSRRR